MSKAPITTIVPSNPADRKAILDAVKEGDNCLTRIDSERDQLKAIIEDIVEKYELPKAQISRLISSYHKSNFDVITQESDDFVQLYEAILG
jgi:hypothetical protein